MAIVTGDIVRFASILRMEDSPVMFVNTWTYRADGEWAATTAQLRAFAEEWVNQIFPGLEDVCRDDSFLSEIHVKYRKNTVDPWLSFAKTFAPGDHPCDGNSSGTFIPELCACANQRSDEPGRKGRGRIFVGPISSNYLGDGGVLLPDGNDPLMGSLDDFLEYGNKEINAAGGTLYPIVAGDTQSSATISETVVTVEWARLATFLRSRRETGE